MRPFPDEGQGEWAWADI